MARIGIGNTVSTFQFAGGSVPPPEFNPSKDGKTFSPTPQDAAVLNMWMSSDGTKMFLPGAVNQRIFQYSMSVAWDVSTATYDNKSFDYTAQDTGNAKITMSRDGTKMYLAPSTTDDIYQYTLSTANDVSTASYDSKTLAVSDSSVGGLYISDDGTKFFHAGQTTDKIWSYNLTTPYDLSTAVLIGVMATSTTNSVNVGAINVNSDGTELWVINNLSGATPDKFAKFTMSTPWDASTLVDTGTTFNTDVTASDGGFFNFATGQAWVVSNADSLIYQYSSI